MPALPILGSSGRPERALLVGAIGFIGGFFGPILFAPGANQGPLLGIFITGPLGFVVGGIGGAARWFVKGRGQDRRDWTGGQGR